jgi:hypothetical protein
MNTRSSMRVSSVRVTTKSNGVAKTIDNMFDIVKDRIQDKYDLYVFCGSVNERLTT